MLLDHFLNRKTQAINNFNGHASHYKEILNQFSNKFIHMEVSLTYFTEILNRMCDQIVHDYLWEIGKERTL
jgi:hypothetical protein